MNSARGIRTKILGWLIANLALLILLLLALFPDALSPNQAGVPNKQTTINAEIIAQVIEGEIRHTTPDQWDEILARYGLAYGVRFFLFENGGTQLAGSDIKLPEEVQRAIAEGHPSPSAPSRENNQRSRINGHPSFYLQTSNPDSNWLGLRMPAPFFENGPPTRATLIATSKEADTNELFVTQSPWLKLLLGSIGITAAIWLPFIRSLTSSIGKMTTVAESIARGKLDARVESVRGDELGKLSQSIDDMATKLEGHVKGQKQFLGDIAHELSSPIARMRFALGILEQRLGDAHQTGLKDLEEEVEAISSLVEELLAFSKASLRPEQVILTPVNVSKLITSVVRRESNDGKQFKIDSPTDLEVFGDNQLLSRALGNVVRNAIRYAGSSGPILLSATREGGTVHISVIDSGPGIPAEHLPKVFSPFYRPDSSRTRNTGGAGLGLSIVKTCVETCQGTVFCQNHKPTGLAVTIILRTADSSAATSP